MQHPMLNIAMHAARKAGDLIVKNYEIPNIVEINQKDSENFITIVNRNAERLIIEIIHKFYPKHSILSKSYHRIQNTEKKTEEQNIQWVINPLDGSTNFIKRLPHFAVSVAVRIKGRTEVAAVYDPMRNELFTAVRGRGAQLNGYRLRCKHIRRLNCALLATDFSFRKKQHSIIYMKLIIKLFTQCADFRHTGSSALDLCYVAANRIDGYFETEIKPLNFAASELIAREAGALITDFSGGHSFITTGNIIVGNPHIVKSLLIIIQNELNNSLKK